MEYVLSCLGNTQWGDPCSVTFGTGSVTRPTTNEPATALVLATPAAPQQGLGEARGGGGGGWGWVGPQEIARGASGRRIRAFRCDALAAASHVGGPPHERGYWVQPR